MKNAASAWDLEPSASSSFLVPVRLQHSGFVIRHYLVILISTFGIRRPRPVSPYSRTVSSSFPITCSTVTPSPTAR